VSYDAEVAERIRRSLSGRDDVTEKQMVGGGLSFLVGGHLCCGVAGAALMVRVGPDGRRPALAEPHVRPMQFAGRAMSGFVCVDPPGFGSDEDLRRWLQRGLDVVAGLPARPSRRAR
jgi:hypothetical protein